MSSEAVRFSSSVNQNVPCFQKGLTKVALVAIALLLAIGPLVSYVTGLGTVATATLGSVTALPVALFVISCVCTVKNGIQEAKEQKSIPLKPEKTHKAEAKPVDPVVEEEIENLEPVEYDAPLHELVKMDVTNLTLGESGAFNAYCRALSAKLYRTNPFMWPTHLQSLFDQVKDDLDRSQWLLAQVIYSSNYVAAITSSVLEKLEFSEELKELIPSIFGECLIQQSNFFIFQNAELSLSESSDTIPIERILLNTKKIFGRGDFNSNPQPLSPLLAEAIGHALRKIAQAKIIYFTQEAQKGNLNKDSQVGFEIEVMQFFECRFPASMIAPLLPHLQSLPGLVKLTLSDVGVCNPFNPSPYSSNSKGFGDATAEDLLKIISTNPHLVDVKINVDGMTEGVRANFLNSWGKILQARGAITLPSPQILLEEGQKLMAGQPQLLQLMQGEDD